MGLLLVRTVREFYAKRLYMHGAALSYYTVFALVPMIVLAVGVLGLFLDEAFIHTNIENEMMAMFGENATRQILNAAMSSSWMRDHWVLTVVGIGMIILSSTAVLYSMQYSINQIWGIELPEKGNFLRNLKDRLISFTMLLILALLFMVSLFLDTAIGAMSKYIALGIPGTEQDAVDLIQFAISIAFNILVFAMIFKFLSYAKVSWGVVRTGAIFTAIMFQLGQTLIGMYLGFSGFVTSWGAAGSLVIILFWVFYASQTIYLGVKFTSLYADYIGKPIVSPPQFMLSGKDNS